MAHGSELPPTLSHIRPFRVMEVMGRAAELAAAGRDIIHLEVGEPDFATAQPIVDAAHEALDADRTHYTVAAGIEPLREAIAGHYRDRYGIAVAPARVQLTPGASGGLLLLAHLLAGPANGILLTDPAYPCVPNVIRLAGGEPQPVPVGVEGNFQPTAGDLAAARTATTTGVWLASPANPTGAVLDAPALSALARWARESGLRLVVDEIYHGLCYDGAAPSVLEFAAEAFVVGSFSKYFGMTGWRLGWIVVPDWAVEPVAALAQNLFISAPTIAQYAALAAFSPQTREILEARREEYGRRGRFLAAALADLGFGLPERLPGAFYLYADTSRFAADSQAFCRQMLEDHGLAITPGIDFGEHLADRHVRFAFTTGMENLERAVERLHRALRPLSRRA